MQRNFLFLNLYICATRCCKPLIFQTMNSIGSNSFSLKHQRFTSTICEDIGIRKFKFVVRTLSFSWKNWFSSHCTSFLKTFNIWLLKCRLTIYEFHCMSFRIFVQSTNFNLKRIFKNILFIFLTIQTDWFINMNTWEFKSIFKF